MSIDADRQTTSIVASHSPWKSENGRQIITRSRSNINAVYRGRTALCVAIQRYDRTAVDFSLQHRQLIPAHHVYLTLICCLL